MERNEHNILFHELIGLDVTILSHSNPYFIGINGKIVDETMNTLKILLDNGKILTVLKRYGLFEITLPRNRKAIIDGSQILGRPEDRLKRLKSVNLSKLNKMLYR